MERVTIKPAKGKIVRNPSGCRPIPTSGVTVVLNTYWRKRIADGAVEIVGPPAPVKPAVKGGDK